jgi:hypothetical protein
VEIRIPVSYVKIEGGWVKLELLTAREARAEMGVSHYVWDRWCRDGWMPGHTVDRTERLYDRHQLDTAATSDGPIREFIRNRDEEIEEVIHG